MPPADRSWTLVVPSRGRPQNMARILRLFPYARICVDEREESVYGPVVPADQLWWHPPISGFAKICNWIRDHVETRSVVYVGDDTLALIAMIGRKPRKIVDPGAIQQVVVNGLTIACDLDLSICSWLGRFELRHVSGADPFAWSAPVLGPFGLTSTRLRFDERLSRGDDVDLSLQALLRERVMVQDKRFFWETIPFGRQAGGMSGTRTSEDEERSMRLLQHKWGGYVAMQEKLKGGSKGASIRVRRRQPTSGV